MFQLEDGICGYECVKGNYLIDEVLGGRVMGGSAAVVTGKIFEGRVRTLLNVVSKIHAIFGFSGFN